MTRFRSETCPAKTIFFGRLSCLRLLPFTDVHLPTGRMGGRGVLPEPPIGQRQAAVDMGVVRLVVCNKRVRQGRYGRLSPHRSTMLPGRGRGNSTLLHSTDFTLHTSAAPSLTTSVFLAGGRALHTTHFTLHTAHCTLHTAYCTLDTAYNTLQTARCTLHTTNYRVHTPHSICCC